MKALVGAFVDGARNWVVGVALTEGQEVQRKTTVPLLLETKDEAIRCVRWPLLS